MSERPTSEDQLLHTRWLTTCVDDERCPGLVFGSFVEVLKVNEGSVFICALYTDHLRTWEVSTSSFFATPSAFRYLATRAEMGWLHRGAFITQSTAESTLLDEFRTCQVDRFSSGLIYFLPRPYIYGGQVQYRPNNPCRWADILTQFRPATTEEVSQYVEHNNRFRIIPEQAELIESATAEVLLGSQEPCCIQDLEPPEEVEPEPASVWVRLQDLETPSPGVDEE